MGSLYSVDGVTGDITTTGSITAGGGIVSTSTTAGFLLPSMTSTQRDAIVSPATGLEIFNTTTNQSEFYNGSAWVAVGGSTPGGSTTQIQYNNAGAFAGSANLSFDGTNTFINGMTLGTGSGIQTIIQGTNIAAANTAASSLKFYSSQVALTCADPTSPTQFVLQSNNANLNKPFVLPDATSYIVLGNSVNTTNVALDVQSTTKAFAPPRMTTTQKNAIGSPSAGMIVYDSTLNSLQDYNGSAWVAPVTPGGTTGQIEYNNGGVFGGLTINTSTTPLFISGGELRISISTPLSLTSGTLYVLTDAVTIGQAGPGGSLNLINTSVTPGSYSNAFFTVDATGRLTAATNGSIATKITTYTIASTDQTILASATGGAFAVTLPSVSVNVGRYFIIKKTDSSANAVTVTPASGTIDGASTFVLTAQYQSVTVQSDGTNWWVI
jgi:hypothetical protein